MTPIPRHWIGNRMREEYQIKRQRGLAGQEGTPENIEVCTEYRTAVVPTRSKRWERDPKKSGLTAGFRDSSFLTLQSTNWALRVITISIQSSGCFSERNIPLAYPEHADRSWCSVRWWREVERFPSIETSRSKWPSSPKHMIKSEKTVWMHKPAIKNSSNIILGMRTIRFTRVLNYTYKCNGYFLPYSAINLIHRDR